MKMEKLRELIESLLENKDQVLCFYGFNDGRKKAERLYICYESSINLYSKLLHYEPLLGKMVKEGKVTWETLKETLEKHGPNYKKKWNSVRLIHGEYPSTGMDTDHGAQVCGFDSLDALMNDISSPDRGEIGHCMLANPSSPNFDEHSILTKEQMFKDALYFCQDRESWKFLFEWGDNVEEKCNSYTPTQDTPTPKDDRYYNLLEQRKLMEQILEFDPKNEVILEKLPKILKELEKYEI